MGIFILKKKRMKSNLFFTVYTKISPKEIIHLNLKGKTIDFAS